MSLTYLILLSGVQGLTEFLPISSSGHLVFMGTFFKIEGHSQLFDVAMHVGTLVAVILYLWRDVAFMMKGFFIFLMGKPSQGAKLLFMLVVGSIPICFFGYFLHYFYPNGISSVYIIGWMTLVFGIILVLADKVGMTVRRIEHLNFLDSFLIGLIQVLALVPGASRSGLCMTVARILGMERQAAARFTMLLGMPAILGAGTLKYMDLWNSGDILLTHDIFIAMGLSFVFALISITFMMAWLRRASFMPFGIYRVILGAGILIYVS